MTDYDDNRIPLDDADDEFPGPDETVPAADPDDGLGPTRMLAWCIIVSVLGMALGVGYRLLQQLEVIPS